jgi:hypothetical protein
MAYFPDLSTYAYFTGRSHRGVINVGWLCCAHPYEKGTVAPHLVEKLKALAAHPVQLTRGFHVCDFCGSHVERAKDRMGNGEIRLTVCSFGRDEDLQGEVDPNARIGTRSDLVFVKKVTFAAPVLIVHYIEAHGYLPPTEFLNAVAMHRMD